MVCPTTRDALSVIEERAAGRGLLGRPLLHDVPEAPGVTSHHVLRPRGDNGEGSTPAIVAGRRPRGSSWVDGVDPEAIGMRRSAVSWVKWAW